MPDAVKITLALHPDARQRDGLVSRERVILVSADIGAHDENHADCAALAKDLCRRIASLPRPASPRALAEAATSSLGGQRRRGFIVSFTVVELDDEGATIMNCGGHRVVSVTDCVETITGDGFVDHPESALRSYIQQAGGPELPVPPKRVHVARVRYDEVGRILISPLAQLADVENLAGCTSLDELTRVVQAATPRRRIALVGISRLELSVASTKTSSPA